MISLEFPKLQEVGSVDFASIPIPLETLSLPELSVVTATLISFPVILRPMLLHLREIINYKK